MRTIRYIVVHCTATSPKAKVSAIQNYWWRHLGWRNPGYHFIVRADGSVVQLLDISKVSNGVRGYNAESIHISYMGGLAKGGSPLDTRTDEQKQSIERLLKTYKTQFPDAQILGHRDFPGVKKACPSFDAKREYQNL